MLKNRRLLLVAVGYLVVLAYWVFLYLNHSKSTNANYYYGLVEAFYPFLMGLVGISTARLWGGRKSALGNALIFISLGVIAWGIGSIVWSYYAIRHIDEIPYPSLADVGYILAIPLWAYGMTKLAKTTGAKFGLKHPKKKILAVILPLILIAVSYYLLVIVARGGTLVSDTSTSQILKVILDISYPAGDAIILTLAVLVFGLSSGYLGGRYKLPIYVLLSGFIVQYVADFTFSFSTTKGTYYNGHWADLFYPTALGLMMWGVNSIVPPKVSELTSLNMPKPEPQPSPYQSVSPQNSQQPEQQPQPQQPIKESPKQPIPVNQEVK